MIHRAMRSNNLKFNFKTSCRRIAAAGGLLLVLAASPARAQQPWVGIWMGQDKPAGVPVLEVFNRSPAANAGIQRGDRLMAVAGRKVSTVRQVLDIVRFHRVGTQLKMDLVRAGMPYSVDVLLEARPSYNSLLRTMWVGKPAPGFTLKGVHGKRTVQLGKLKGKVVLVEFWAVWCTACRVAVATLKRWQRTYTPRGLEIVSVGKDAPADLAKFARQRQITYFVGNDTGWLSRLYRVSPIPAFILIDRQGKIRDVAVGLGISFNRMEGTLQKLLAAKYPRARAGKR